MRHETCLTCRMPDARDPQLRMMILLAESIGDFTHHHHTVRCEGREAGAPLAARARSSGSLIVRFPN
jgi:hypothetical protein